MKPPAEHCLNTFAAFSQWGKSWNFIKYSVSTAPGFSPSPSSATATAENQGLMHWNSQHHFKKHLQPKKSGWIVLRVGVWLENQFPSSHFCQICVLVVHPLTFFLQYAQRQGSHSYSVQSQTSSIKSEQHWSRLLPWSQIGGAKMHDVIHLSDNRNAYRKLACSQPVATAWRHL